ncbi:LLM class flavin-dependent oxidoreductase [Amycolatopsis circi]|uniref:LLM class flavin-dependent oxidoreductase n=1 Tax=Amycolatopsis circi TaxID=871959 RepID=UPI001ABFB44A|nr:LLM class flavin-dependent oxidoreductase [Amycolatopsis circi]
MTVKVGINHSALNDGAVPHPGAVARRIEDLGLDSFWCGDHLSTEDATLESSLALAAAAAATERIDVGFAVLQLALRPSAWVAKQIGTLHFLSEDRLLLGVGVGGDRPDEWAAAGVPLKRRGRRTDALLRALPRLLSGDPTCLPDNEAAEVTLLPAVPMPPVWVGGHSLAALRRTARYGQGWLPALLTPEQIQDSMETVARFADEAGNATPAAGVQLFTAITSAPGGPEHRQLAGMLSAKFGLSEQQATEIVVSGPPEHLAEQIAKYEKAGVEHVVLSPIGSDSWELRTALAAEAKALL